MTSNFTARDNFCGSRLSSLVCRGHRLIATVLKSANEIPPVFMEGYAIEEFSSSYYFQNDESSCATTSNTSSSSSMSSFFGSTVVRSIFGNNNDTKNAKRILRKIRSQAPSFRQNCSVTPQSQLESTEDKFLSILIDFAYLSNPDQFEANINASKQDDETIGTNTTASVTTTSTTTTARRSAAAEQEHLEREFATKYQPTLKKYYSLFEDIFHFYTDVQSFVTDLDSGHFVEYTLRSLLLENVEARQLLCEVLYLYGSLLVLLDIYIPGEIRERLIIAHYRYCETDTRNDKSSTFEDICKLCERTDYSVESVNNNASNASSTSSSAIATTAENRQPQIQPELLSRLPLPKPIIKSIIECIITVELYPDQAFAFPSYDHRSSKLGHQAAMVVILLFFNPTIMAQNESIMRQIVEKFFHDTWVIPLYNGAVLDLSVEWNLRFPAAMNALKHIVDRKNIQRLNYENMKTTISCIEEVKRYLIPNGLSPKSLLDVGNNVLDFLRKANVALRWQMLHRASHLCPRSENNDSSAMIVDEHDILSFILLVSQFEVHLNELYRELLKTKEEIRKDCRDNSIETMSRLSRHFFGNEELNTVEKNEDLGQWFDQMKDEICALDTVGNDKVGGEIQFCIEALDDIVKLDLVDSDNQVIDMIRGTRKNLVHLAKSFTVKENVCAIINAISDFSYAREIIECLLPLLHSQSMRNPKSVSLLRAFFLKTGRQNLRFQELVETPFNDLDHVTKYHEKAMLSFVKETLDVIPITIFSTLAHIADEKSLAQVPAKIEADRLGDYLHFENRYKLAKITFELSVLTKGIFAMEKTLIGDLEIKPRSILEEGLRKELVRQYSTALHSALQFQIPKERTKQSLIQHKNSCMNILTSLGSRIEGFQRSMIWLQDFLEIDGLHIFMNETSRVIKCNVKRELRNLTQRSLHGADESDEDDGGVPIPFFARSGTDGSSATFVGRTMNALIHLTDPKHAIYSNHLYGWYFLTGESVCGMRTITSLRNTIGVIGLAGIDKLLSCKIRNELLRFVKFYSNIQSYSVILEQFRDAVFPEWKRPDNGMDIYEAALRRSIKLMLPLTKSFCRIGQLQLLRRLIKSELRLAVDHKVLLSCSIRNKCLVNNMLDQSCKKSISEMESVSEDLSAAGLTNPLADVFLRTNSLEGLSSLITLYVIDTMRKMNYDSELGALLGKEEETVDGWALVAGVATVLKQFNASYTNTVFALVGQYLMCSVESHLENARVEDLPRRSKETQNIIVFMKQLCSIANLDATMMYQSIPQYLIEMIAAQQK